MANTTVAQDRVRIRARLLERGGLTLGWLVALPLLVVVIGSFFPDIPYVGLADVVSGLAGWFTLVLLFVAAGATWLLIRSTSTARVVLVVVATLSLLGNAVITAHLMSVASTHGISVNPLATGPGTSRPDETVQYSEHDGSPLTASVWRPSRTQVDGAAADGAPVAFFVHGGGWTSGSSTDDNAGLRARMADEGWLVVSIDYTLADDQRPTWDIATNEVICAMAWTAENAAAYGGDADRFAVLGDSAGGNLALNGSYQVAAGTASTTCGPLPPISATAVVYPGVSPAAIFENDAAVAGALGRSLVDQYVGGSPTQYPERFTTVASSTYLSASAPPTFIVQGENDHLVPAGPVHDFVDDAHAAGIDITLVTVPYADHVFDATPLGSQIYVETTLEWLTDQGLSGRS